MTGSSRSTEPPSPSSPSERSSSSERTERTERTERSGRSEGPTLGPARIAALEDQLALELGGLDDLDAEFEAGDLDEADYRTLRDDYTVRVADTMRRLERQRDLETDIPRRRLNLVVIGVIVLFAVGAGWLLARSTGERGVNDILTGDIASTRQRVFDCQALAADGEIVESLQCLDGVLLEDPDNVSALTYRGWYLVLTTASVEATGDTAQANELLETGLTYIDRAIELDAGFADARAFRSVVYDRQGRRDDTCAEIAALLDLDPPPFFVDQTAPIAARNGCT